MKQFKVPGEYASDSFLTDNHLSLSAKGYLILNFLGYFDNPYDVDKYCDDHIVDIEDTIRELRRKKYLKYDSKTDSLVATHTRDECTKQKNKRKKGSD